ncbi:DUF4265 domain-containing protein [Pseudomonas sp. NPDC087817]|uniref:DUF4265 domain-containing protein n=1 Tax=Pseudomonas sp. NPDC087817 TaxID=3364451 RepID=UPI0037FDB48D
MTDIFHKIIFKLTPDEDDYPPFSVESVWGIYRGKDVYEIDNTPYYVHGVSKGDRVQVQLDGEERIAARVVSQGGHSTIRVFASDPGEKAKIITRLQEYGAFCLSTRGLSLFAVDIPASCDFSMIDSYLSSIADGENIAYGDACLQHYPIEPSRVLECSSLASIPCLLH